MSDPDAFFPAQSHAPGWPARTKFTMLAYAYKLREAGEDTLPFEFKVSSDRVGWMVIKVTSPRRGGLPTIQSLITRVKEAISDEELDGVYASATLRFAGVHLSFVHAQLAKNWFDNGPSQVPQTCRCNYGGKSE
eukprot:m.247038 g.247038  ORF g.247038 m.247038 type:complete len:134 (+) comp15858_c0_seq14:1196-1597(+)